MKHNIVILICLLLTAACNNAGSGLVKKRVAGTPVTLELPSDFFADPSIVGFRHTRSRATILIASAPVSYTQAVSDMSSEKLNTIGQKLMAEEEVTINGTAGRLYKIAFQSEGNNLVQWRLVIPQHKNILTINGTFPADEEQKVSPLVKSSLLTTTIDPTWKPDPAILDFGIESNAIFKLAKVEGRAAVYTADGAWTNESMANNSIFCSSAPSAGIINKDEFSIQNFRTFCTNCTITGQDSTAIATLKAKEIWGTSSDSTGTHLRYQAILFDSAKYYVVLGTSADTTTSRLTAFRNTVKHWSKR